MDTTIVKDIFDDFNKFTKILSSENDRGAALCSGGFIEKSLEAILKAFMVDNKSTQDIIEGFSAPIGTWSAKMKLAHSLGLIDDEMYSRLNLIRKIRNEFAHTWEVVSFEKQNIRQLLLSIPVPAMLKDLEAKSLVSTVPRKRFNNIVSCTLIELQYLPEMILREKRTTKRYVSFSQSYNTLDEAKLAAEDGKKI